VRLTNGATIKADEAWERREGIWYRQGGMVTFLKRGRVRTIERPSRSLLKAAANNVEEKNRKSNSVAAQNQLRIRKLEPPDTKKQSRVRSFLKKTGRMLKKPFTF
jgi:DNA replication protein DnaD